MNSYPSSKNFNEIIKYRGHFNKCLACSIRKLGKLNITNFYKFQKNVGTKVLPISFLTLNIELKGQLA